MEEVEELFILLNSIYPLPEEVKEHLKEILKWKQLSQGEYLLKAGHFCEHVYFVKKGLLRSYYLKDNKTEVNNWFMKQGDVVYAVRSFLLQIPSDEYIQVLEDAEFFYISQWELEKIYEEHIIFNIHGRKLTQKYYLLSEERSFIMRMNYARERYDYLFTHYPDLVNAIPDKDLATYLGVRPVTISRIRGSSAKKRR